MIITVCAPLDTVMKRQSRSSGARRVSIPVVGSSTGAACNVTAACVRPAGMVTIISLRPTSRLLEMSSTTVSASLSGAEMETVAVMLAPPAVIGTEVTCRLKVLSLMMSRLRPWLGSVPSGSIVLT